MNKSTKEARAGLIPSEETEALPVVTMRVTHREYDTILAALRSRQAMLDLEKPDVRGIEEIATDHGDALSPNEIDELIGRVQFEDSCPVIFLEGGLVQDVLIFRNGTHEQIAYELLDLDILEGEPDQEVAEYWESRSRELRTYMKAQNPHEAGYFERAVRRHKAAQRKAALLHRRYFAIGLPSGLKSRVIDVLGGDEKDKAGMDAAIKYAHHALGKSVKVTLIPVGESKPNVTITLKEGR